MAIIFKCAQIYVLYNDRTGFIWSTLVFQAEISGCTYSASFYNTNSIMLDIIYGFFHLKSGKGCQIIFTDFFLKQYTVIMQGHIPVMEKNSLEIPRLPSFSLVCACKML